MRPLPRQLKKPSTFQLKYNYGRINRIAFGGRLPKDIEFLEWGEMYHRDIHQRCSLGRSLFTGDWAAISINFDLHRTEKQWLLTLIHEMVHGYTGAYKCHTPKFQRAVFRAVSKMRYNLL